jgi:DNA/RNA-binding domain of Phe-tRNA-synthetase-like protein
MTLSSKEPERSRAYRDLKAQPERASEAAEELRKRVLNSTIT